ncbi:MAG: sodium-independent anion transporter, partial [Clostridia bacterium]
PSFRKRMTIERKVDEILTIKVKGSIYVFNVDTIIKTVQERDTSLKRVIIDFSEVSTVDATACDRLGKLKKSLQTSDNTLDFTNVSEKTAKRIYSFQSL